MENNDDNLMVEAGWKENEIKLEEIPTMVEEPPDEKLPVGQEAISIWRAFKHSLNYSPVRCMVCMENLYYGKRFMQKDKVVTDFHCRCKEKAVHPTRDVCAICGSPVERRATLKEVMRLHCTCGHFVVLDVARIEDTPAA